VSQLDEQVALKARLDRTWTALFARHGHFTTTQLAAIPPILSGENVMLCAPTASGKTEAAIAPLIERHIPPKRSAASPAILYITPTKALVNDLWARLKPPLESPGITVGVKTRDVNTLRGKDMPDVLISTPESCDSLLTTAGRSFANLRAIVIDELHLFDGTPRGDHLRVVLNRIRHIRAYAATQGDAPDDTVQYVALSASLPAPAIAAARYFPDAALVTIAGGRSISAAIVPLSQDGVEDMLACLSTFRERGWRKALAFCNTRAEVEAYAAAIRGQSPFGDTVFVHYSNLEPKRRHEIERQFSAAPAAMCFASSTLELGIDIGSVDVILLIGAPGNAASFVQRIGRGSRRQQVIRAQCFYRAPLERLIFEVLSHDPDAGAYGMTGGAFRPAVAVQGIFSLLKQSPTGAVRLAQLKGIFDGMVSEPDLTAILGQLESLNYLKPGRSGEWRAGERLRKLIDQQTNPHNPLSLYSNIRGSDAPKIEIRDQHTHQTVARVDQQWLDRPLLTLEGRVVNVEWFDGEAMWISPAPEQTEAAKLRYRSSRQVLAYDLAQRLPSGLGLAPGEAPLVPCPEGWLWFHWLGDLYGTALYDLMRGNDPVRSTPHTGLCLLFAAEPDAFSPVWADEAVTRYLSNNYRRLETLMDVGPYHHLLPTSLRRKTVIEQFDLARFQDATRKIKVMPAPDLCRDKLLELIAAEMP